MMREWILGVARGYEGGPALLLAGRAVQLVNGLLLSIILVQRFGLAALGTFAIGLAAVNIIAIVCPLGLHNHLPRLRQSLAQSSYAGLVLQIVQLPLVALLLWPYAALLAHDAGEARIIYAVALSGFFIGLGNMGMMLAIMHRRFGVGLAAPLCETAGMLAGTVLAATPAGFAVYLLLARLASATLIWSGFHYQRLPAARLRGIARASVHYVVNDTLTVAPEQAAPLLLATVVSRGELGLFRLCQQLLMAADTPVWTFVQSRYPRMVDGDAEFHAGLARQVDRMALLASVACVGGSAVLALVFFGAPQLALLMLVLSPCLLWRYRAYLYGQALRASGRLAAVTQLAATRLVLALAALTIATERFGLWGAVVTVALLSVATGTAYEWTFRHGVTLRPARLIPHTANSVTSDQ
ncbi:MAG: lipopolysaccharide biosynthesis protein [Candidatus Binatia bacterium]